MSFKQKFLSGLVTKLDNFFFFKAFIKSQLKLMVSKMKLQTDLIFAWTLKICYM